ncbi:MAG: hypothetical protein ACI9GH_000174 [Candidatus Paceibacteria bacterium]|jgi:hypothetical protein
MNNWKRSILVFVLFGSITLFSYWSNNQFNQVFNNLNDLFVTNSYSGYLSKQNAELATTSPAMMGELATSTDGTIPGVTSTTTVAISTSVTDTNLEFSFTFPQEGGRFFIGCTYPISWQSSTTIDSLEIDLVDAGTRDVVGPIASGLTKENTIEKDLQNLKWKVGVVWSGAYYIKVSKINSTETEFRSEAFEINKMLEDISASEKEVICKGSGGSS